MRPSATVGFAHSPRPTNRHMQVTVVATTLNAQVTPLDVAAIAARLRATSRKPMTTIRIVSAIATACERWRDPHYAPRRETIGAIAAARDWSEPLLDESIDALLAPFTRSALADLASQMPRRNDLVGLIVPGNIPGAGIHEFATALLAGCSLIVKTATAEPFFFAHFIQTLRELDSELGARVAVLNWSRDRHDLTAAMRADCDWIAAFGNDNTIKQLGSIEAPFKSKTAAVRRPMVGFGGRVSGALVTKERATRPSSIAIADLLARDVSLFEQQGCLSPHHVFVESTDPAVASEFARDLAAALDRFANRVPPPRRYGLEDAAAVRRVRESARWSEIGGAAVTLIESDGLAWTVVYDHDSSFTTSPGYRSVTVSPFRDLDDLTDRLDPVAGQIEAFAIAASDARYEYFRSFLMALDVYYLCPPGAMQSPPLDWNHGGGAFMRALSNPR
jgi:Acyl-CoA reductase (LuxC)